jgi:hypothetical protein
MLPSSSLTVPDVQLSRFRFFMEEGLQGIEWVISTDFDWVFASVGDR